jgi:L-malate glycosyltransferase
MFAPWEPHVGVELANGRHELAELAEATVLGLADSSYNEAELLSLGFARTAVAPILLDSADFEGDADRTVLADLMARKRSGGADWLFVGRISPNKAQHDVIKALAVYRRVVDPHARLTLVGGSSSHRYMTALEDLVKALDLGDAVHVAGSVSHEALLAHYRASDVFVCLSDHEGFCVPLLESMHAEVPIVAFASTAVPETLGDAGVLLPTKSPVEVALAVQRVVTDTALRSTLVAAGRRRLDRFSLERTSKEFVDAVVALVGERA